MSASDVYGSLPVQWRWPNRRMDLDYSALGADELDDLYRKWRDGDGEQWGQLQGKLWKPVPVDLGVCGFVNEPPGYHKRLRDKMETFRILWMSECENGRADSSFARMCAHSWHMCRMRLNVWEPGAVRFLTHSQFLESGRDAAGDLIYTNWAQPLECQRMVLNALVRSHGWLSRLAALGAGGMTSGEVRDPRSVTVALRKFEQSLVQVWGRPRAKDGWHVAGLPGVDGVGWLSSWVEIRSLIQVGPRVMEACDRWEQGASSKSLKEDRRLVTRLRLVCENSLGYRIGALVGVCEAEGA